ncbi:hypothetical protein ACJX0J_018828, partial [Zea mays]
NIMFHMLGAPHVSFQLFKAPQTVKQHAWKQEKNVDFPSGIYDSGIGIEIMHQQKTNEAYGYGYEQVIHNMNYMHAKSKLHVVLMLFISLLHVQGMNIIRAQMLFISFSTTLYLPHVLLHGVFFDWSTIRL